MGNIERQYPKHEQQRTSITVTETKTNNGVLGVLGETPDLEWGKFSSLHK